MWLKSLEFRWGLYRYFNNKDDLSLILICDVHENWLQSIRAGHHDFASDLHGKLIKSNKGYLSHYYDYRNFVRV